MNFYFFFFYFIFVCFSILCVEGHTGPVFAVDIDSNSRYIGAGGADGMVTIWDYKEMICIRSLGSSEASLRTLSFSHDSQLIAYASEDYRIEICDVESGIAVHYIEVNSGLNSIAFAPKQLLLAYAPDDNNSKIAGNIYIYGFKQ